MRIRNIISPLDRHDLKPAKGDVVLFEGEEYIVMDVGVRWVYMYLASDTRKVRKMAKISAVVKKPLGADVQA